MTTRTRSWSSMTRMVSTFAPPSVGILPWTTEERYRKPYRARPSDAVDDESCPPIHVVRSSASPRWSGRPQQALAGWGGGRVRAGVLQKQLARPLTYRPVNNGGSGGKG